MRRPDEYDVTLKCVVFADKPEFSKEVLEKFSGEVVIESGYVSCKVNCNGLNVKLLLHHAAQKSIFYDNQTVYEKPGFANIRNSHIALFLYDMTEPDVEKVKLYTSIMESWYGENPNTLFYVAGIRTKKSVKEDAEIAQFIRHQDRTNLRWDNQINLESKEDLKKFFEEIVRIRAEQEDIDVKRITKIRGYDLFFKCLVISENDGLNQQFIENTTGEKLISQMEYQSYEFDYNETRVKYQLWLVSQGLLIV